ncbi:MAG: GNAT family protein [Candidatus Margulisbacteria bacterium]|nr:GNAT family protein [Candidatus Margulisiibacteriota bacterium]
MNNGYKHFIEGKIIYLREVRPADVNENYYRWLNDPEVNQFLETHFVPQSMENIKRYVERMDGKSDEIFLAMCLKENDRHVGNIKLGPINWIHRNADISLVIGEKEYWGKGIATDAIRALSGFAFNVLNLNNLKAGCYAENKGSKGAFIKVGFKEVGLIKDDIYFQGKYTDHVLLALNKKEFTGANL